MTIFFIKTLMIWRTDFFRTVMTGTGGTCSRARDDADFWAEGENRTRTHLGRISQNLHCNSFFSRGRRPAGHVMMAFVVVVVVGCGGG